MAMKVHCKAMMKLEIHILMFAHKKITFSVSRFSCFVVTIGKCITADLSKEIE